MRHAAAINTQWSASALIVKWNWFTPLLLVPSPFPKTTVFTYNFFCSRYEMAKVNALYS